MKENENTEKDTGRGRAWQRAGLAALAVILVCGLACGMSRSSVLRSGRAGGVSYL